MEQQQPQKSPVDVFVHAFKPYRISKINFMSNIRKETESVLQGSSFSE
ncbi:MAG: hypothetical protein AVDCRST_MAG95-3278 [uncultured Adhaeribacter sp.]|uniref:Uncharacterized protein n=1 Tax=uncultured Adhaeribacter sp. TaxID=448109 RepID=A0A6J4JJ03_9BACT|nr:MAG: hypothetical protein AVDCRST_MAG95-3278 [uncultured Adhaeribacter sp.]